MAKKKYKQLVTTGLFPFAVTLKNVREYKNLSRRDVGNMINRGAQQIQRYETLNKHKQLKDLHQHPTLHQFKKLCIALQIDPNTLLGLKWIETDQPCESDFIYEWKLTGDKVDWICPVCIRQNITYNDFRRHPKLLKKQVFDCEYSDCGASFNKLYELKNE